MATRKGKSATSCFVRLACLLAVGGGADAFRGFTEVVLYSFGLCALI